MKFLKGGEVALNKIMRSEKSKLILIIILICILFTILNPDFFSLVNLLNLIRAGLVNMVFAICVLIVMVSGGMDISFMAIASCAVYGMTKLCTVLNLNPPLIVIFIGGAVIGGALGCVNSFFVAKTKMPIFIVTLGTMNLIKGGLVTFLGTAFLTATKSMQNFSKSSIITVTNDAGTSASLPVAFVIIIALYIITSFMLKHTKFGRSIYAIGGDREAAARCGINIVKIQCLVFVLAGVIASIGGILNGCLLRTVTPNDLIGNEMVVIAAVILGGGKQNEGRGTVSGTLFGIILITILNNSLTLIGIPSFWQKAVLGAIIVLGTISQSTKTKANLVKA